MSSDSGESDPASFESIEGEIAAHDDDTTRMGEWFKHAVQYYFRHGRVGGCDEAWLWDEWPERGLEPPFSWGRRAVYACYAYCARVAPNLVPEVGLELTRGSPLSGV